MQQSNNAGATESSKIVIYRVTDTVTVQWTKWQSLSHGTDLATVSLSLATGGSDSRGSANYNRKKGSSKENKWNTILTHSASRETLQVWFCPRHNGPLPYTGP